MLTTKQIMSAKPKNSPYYMWDKTRERGTSGKGRMGVQVSRAGSKSFKFRYFSEGKTQFINIGSFPSVSLTDARKIARSYTDMIGQGLDPKLELKRRKQKQLAKQREESSKASLRELFESQRDHKKANGKRNCEIDLKDLEKHVYPFIDPNTKAKDVTTNDIIPVLRELIQRGAATKANKVRSILLAAFNFGLTHDNDPAKNISVGKFDLLLNPVSPIPRQTSAEKVGDHFLEPQELFKLLHDLKYRTEDLRIHQNTRNIIQLCFYLGGQRPNEVCSLKWENINDKEMTVTIPEEVAKNKRPLVIALTQSSHALLTKEREHSTSPYIFPKQSNPLEPTPSNTVAQAVGRYRSRSSIRHFVPRDFRRTFKTLAGRLHISKEIRDRIQGHALSDVSSKHYDRYDYLCEKRAAMEIWCDYLNKGIESLTKS